MKKHWELFLILVLLFAFSVALLPSLFPGVSFLSVSSGLKLGIDLKGGTDILLEADFAPEASSESKQEMLGRITEVVRSRIDSLGVAEPLLQTVGDQRVRLQLPGVKNVERVRELVVKSSKLTFNFFAPDQRVEVLDPSHLWVRAGNGYDVKIEKQDRLTGEQIEYATLGFSEMGHAQVNFKLTPEGSRRFSKMTARENSGRGFAILLDQQVVSEMQVGEPVYGQDVLIQMPGTMTAEEKMKLAEEILVVLRSGSLPAKLQIIEERTVGPTLGTQSIQRGKIALVLSLLAVFVFLLSRYRTLGLIAGLSMLFNIYALLAGLAYIDAALTFSGFAGLVLIVGMGIDANILVFERLREKGRRLGIQAFDETRVTVIDASLTTALPALVLFYFGNGPVRGFATVLLVGLLSSYLSTFLFSRYVFTQLIRK